MPWAAGLLGAASVLLEFAVYRVDAAVYGWGYARLAAALAPALGGGERRWTGTSFATPCVAAHVARLLAASPRMPLESVKAALHTIAAAQALR